MSDYNSIKRDLLRRGELFEDPDFPATGRSIRNDGRMPYGIRWLRPKEIDRNPLFIRDGATRFDLDQGQHGDCWFISAAACLAIGNRPIFERCVPLDQTFSKDYAGIFRFNFWHYDRWIEVVVDDRLPTKDGRLIYAYNREEPNEFWTALLEKAYAKLYKSYENIDGGHINDALVDFTGGISEMINLKDASKVPDNLFEIMFRTLQMNSLCGCSINSSSVREEELTTGLYTSHAYAIISMLQIRVDGKPVQLICLRNPWGRGEWRGAWSDKSSEWRGMSAEDRKRIGFVVRDEGEFWMDIKDWFKEFDMLQFCHLYPDALTQAVAIDTKKKNWEVTTVHDSWVPGFSAGGCGNYPNQELFWTNPQIAVKLHSREDTDRDGKITMVVSLMNKSDTLQFEELFITVMIYKLRSNRPVRMEGDKYQRDDVRLTSPPEKLINLREVTVRMDLSPGVYVIIPCTFEPNKAGEFLVRVYTESKAESNVIDDESRITVPTAPVDKKLDLFRKYTNGDSQMDAYELQNALNDYYKPDLTRGFDVETSRGLLAIMDRDGSSVLGYKEFKKMLKETGVWKNAFSSFDTNRSGNIDTYELTKLFETIGFKLSRSVLSAIVKRYGGKQRRLYFEDFMHCCSKIVVMYEQFKKFEKGSGNKAEIGLEEWLRIAMLY